MNEIFWFPACNKYIRENGICQQTQHILSEDAEFLAELHAGRGFEALLELMDLRHSIETAQRILMAKYDIGLMGIAGFDEGQDLGTDLMIVIDQRLQGLEKAIFAETSAELAGRLWGLRLVVTDLLQELARRQGVELETIRAEVEEKNRGRGYYGTVRR